MAVRTEDEKCPCSLGNHWKCLQVHQRRQADLVTYKKDTWVMVNPEELAGWYHVKAGLQDEDGSFSGNLIKDAPETSAKGKGV